MPSISEKCECRTVLHRLRTDFQVPLFGTLFWYRKNLLDSTVVFASGYYRCISPKIMIIHVEC